MDERKALGFKRPYPGVIALIDEGQPPLPIGLILGFWPLLFFPALGEAAGRRAARECSQDRGFPLFRNASRRSVSSRSAVARAKSFCWIRCRARAISGP